MKTSVSFERNVDQGTVLDAQIRSKPFEMKAPCQLRHVGYSVTDLLQHIVTIALIH